MKDSNNDTERSRKPSFEKVNPEHLDELFSKAYISIADQLPIGIYRTSPDGKFIYTNPALAKMLNYDTVEELMKVNAKQLYENPSERTRQLESSINVTSLVFSEFQLRKKTGELIWVKDRSQLIFDSFGSPFYFDGIIEDITETKNNLNAIKESEANLKAIIENTLENIWSIDRNYEIKYVNEVFNSAFESTFGVRLIKGTNIVESLPDFLRPVWVDRYNRAFNNEHFVFEDRIDMGDTSIFIEVAMNPIVVDGEVVGASFYGRDVTEKRNSEIQLQFLSDLRKLLMDLSTGFINLPLSDIPDAVNLSLQKIGSFVGADRAYVIDYDFDINIGTNTYEWCSEGTEAQIHNLKEVPLEAFSGWIELHKRGEIVKVEDVFSLPQNDLRKLMESQDILSFLTIPLLHQNKCIGLVGFDSVKRKHVYNDYEQELLQIYAQMLVNVKERLEKEQKLIRAKEKAEESDRLKSSFLANMSHEIRTPMNGILGFLDLLKEPDLSEENKASYIDIVTKSGYRLLDTINDIIEVSRIEAGELQVNTLSVNVPELMAYYHGFFRQQTDQKGLTYIISNQLPDGINTIRTDKNKLDSIITNLLKNAVKFTNTGSIEFGCRLDGINIVFWVKDTGIGIDPERVAVVFDRFVQADISNSRTHEGSGLGLSIVKAYINALEGTIIVDSEPGRGSTFSLSIPCNCVPPGSEPEGKTTQTGNRKENNITILIAEDDYSSYLYLENLLSGKGISFLHTTNGIDTIKAVQENQEIDLILMDLKLPGLSGLEAAQQIRHFNTSIPIIAQTAYAFSGDREIAVDAGCNDYISKPINRTELLNLVDKYLRSTETD
jgi:PAS domain S-box-containing protein